MHARKNLSPGMNIALHSTGACFSKTTKSPSHATISGLFARKPKQPAPAPAPAPSPKAEDDGLTLTSIDVSNANADELQTLLATIQRIAPSALVFVSTSDLPTAAKSPARPK